MRPTSKGLIPQPISGQHAKFVFEQKPRVFHSWAAVLWLGCAGMWLGACGDDDLAMDGSVDTNAADAFDGGDVGVIRDTGPICEEDIECDDGIPCTRDVCERGGCRNRNDHAMCDDGIFCNGREICDREARGCAPGPRESCNDNDVCTIDRCDEETKSCRYAPRDFDEDGEADWNCPGGTDCDDRDPTRSSSVAETCSDMVDNDCDEEVDEAMCGRPMYDTCDAPLDVSAGGFFEISSEGASPDHGVSCAPAGRPDLALEFEITEPKNVTLRAEGRGLTYVALRTSCALATSELECGSGFPGQVRTRALEPGRYYVLIADMGGDLAIEVVFTDPTEPPTNESCETPFDVSAGGHFEESFLDVNDDLLTSCGASGSPDLVYTFTLEEEKDVVVAAASPMRDSLSIEIRQTCDAPESTLRCTRGAPAAARVHRLAAGTYFLIVEGSASREAVFGLDVAFEDPSDPAPGDDCSRPLDLPPDTVVMGTLRDKQDAETISCGFFNRESVYQFELEERSDVTVTADGDGAFMNLSLQSTCGERASELRCSSANPGRIRLRDVPPGTYFLLVESFRPVDFEVVLTTSPPTPVEDVAGNDSCETAFVVMANGLFRGDTSILLSDYMASCGGGATSADAVFQITTTESRRLVASTEGTSFDSVLHLHAATCEAGSERVCDDDGGDGTTSLIDQTIDAGTYFLVVDGFGSSSVGEYLLDVQLLEPS